MTNKIMLPSFKQIEAPRKQNLRRGVTLIEMLVAATIMMVSILGMVAVWAQMMRTTLTSDNRGSAYEVAKQVMERSRSLGFHQNLPYTVAHPVNSLGDVSQPTLMLARWRFFDESLREIVLPFSFYDDVSSQSLKPAAPANARFCVLTQISRTDSSAGRIPPDRPDLQMMAIEVTVFDARYPNNPPLYAVQEALTMGGI